MKKGYHFRKALLKADSTIDDPTNYVSHLRQRRMPLEANRDLISEFLLFAEHVWLSTLRLNPYAFLPINFRISWTGEQKQKNVYELKFNKIRVFFGFSFKITVHFLTIFNEELFFPDLTGMQLQAGWPIKNI